MKATIRHSLLAAALALAALPAAVQAADSPFTKTVFFGDSLTDGGYFRPVLIQLVGPNGAIIGQFTNNPNYVWSQYLADFYGSNANVAWTGNNTASPTLAGGNNWAVGGARVGVDSVGGLGYTPSLASQYARYLSSGNKVDPGALYTIWGGANDLFAVQANPGQAQAIIGAAVTAHVNLVGALTQAGAQYILVPTLPDLGLTPDSRAGGAVGMAQGTALANTYNNALFSSLASAGLRVIPMDTFHFLQEVVANPGLYGISNVTGKACLTQPAPAGSSSLFCSPQSTVPGGASYLFADGVHPTSAAHRALADFAISLIEAPRQVAILPYSEAVVGRARSEMVNGAIEGFAKEDGMRWWADVRGDQQRYGAPFHYDGIGPAASFGIGWSSGNLVYGAFAGYGKQDNDFGERRGEFTQTDAGLGGFIGWRGDALWANAQLGWTSVSYDVDRAVHLGPATRVHSGSPDGDNLSIGASAGWNFEHGALNHGPVVSVLSQQISVDGFAESDPTLSTSLAYPEQDFDSLIGSIGWQASYAVSEHLEPYAKLTYDHEFEDAPAQAFAQAQSMPGTLPYAVPGLEFDDSYGTLVFGVRTKLMGLDANAGASMTVGEKGGDDATFFLSVGSRF
jgi:outer membrane lipase/esterase